MKLQLPNKTCATRRCQFDHLCEAATWPAGLVKTVTTAHSVLLAALLPPLGFLAHVATAALHASCSQPAPPGASPRAPAPSGYGTANPGAIRDPQIRKFAATAAHESMGAKRRGGSSFMTSEPLAPLATRVAELSAQRRRGGDVDGSSDAGAQQAGGTGPAAAVSGTGSGHDAHRAAGDAGAGAGAGSNGSVQHDAQQGQQPHAPSLLQRASAALQLPQQNSRGRGHEERLQGGRRVNDWLTIMDPVYNDSSSQRPRRRRKQ